MDATKENELGQKFGVQGFPTIKWFVDGEMAKDYDGGRDAASIVSWVKKKTGPPAATIDAADKLASVEKESQFVVVAYFKSFSVSPEPLNMNSYANT